MLRVSEEIENLVPYKPGKSIDQTRRELGLTDIVKLASNENALGPSPKAVAALKSAVDELHRYPDPSGHDFIQKLASKTGVPAEQILIGNGSNELIDLLIRTFCEPHQDEVVISEGSFVAYEICAQAARVKTHKISQKPNFVIDVEGLVKKVKRTPQAKILFLPNPNNPTGTYVSAENFNFLLQELRNWPGLIVIDEAYLEFVRAKDYPRALNALSQASNIVVLHTFSKVYGLAGLRLGALFGSKNVLDYLHRVRNPFNVNSLAQVAAAAAMEDTNYIQHSQKIVWDGLDYFYKELTRLGLPYWESQGNFVLFDSTFHGNQFFEEVLKEGVILRPVVPYGLPTHIRMSVGRPEENSKAIAAIEKVVQRLRKGKDR